METTGVKTFNTSGRTVAKTSNPPPVAPGEYTCFIRPDHIKVACSDKPGAIPYVAYSIEVQGSALTEGGKNRLVFTNLFIGLKPGKDGVLNIDRANGLTALTRALGTPADGIELLEREFEGEKVDYLNPQQVAEYLRNNAGVEFQAFIKVETSEYKGEKQEKNVVSRFVARES